MTGVAVKLVGRSTCPWCSYVVGDIGAHQAAECPANGPTPHLDCPHRDCDGQRVPYDRVGQRVRWWCLSCHGFSFPTARQKAQAFAVPPSA
jgi:hypothetical protein